MVSHDHGRSLLQKSPIKGLPHAPTPTAEEWGACLLVQPYTINVGASDRVVPGVERGRDRLCILYPDVIWEDRVDRFAESCRRPADRHAHRGHLAGGVDTAIGPSRAHDRPVHLSEPLSGGLQLPLNRALLTLGLPAEEGASVVVKVSARLVSSSDVTRET